MTNNNHIKDHVIHFLALAANAQFAPAKTNNNHDITKTIVIAVPTKNVADNIMSWIKIVGLDLSSLDKDCLIQSVSYI